LQITRYLFVYCLVHKISTLCQRSTGGFSKLETNRQKDSNVSSSTHSSSHNLLWTPSPQPSMILNRQQSLNCPSSNIAIYNQVPVIQRTLSADVSYDAKRQHRLSDQDIFFDNLHLSTPPQSISHPGYTQPTTLPNPPMPTQPSLSNIASLSPATPLTSRYSQF
jgi:hypothetical protein